MNLPRALWISLLVSFAATVILGMIFGGKAFGLFLLLPLGFLFNRRNKSGLPRASDRRPVEPE